MPSKYEHTRVLTTKAAAVPLPLLSCRLCIPEVRISHFSFADPLHSTSCMGIKFSRKSPAVGSIKRHLPSGALMEILLKARVAVSSRWWDSATAVGCNMPPARETGTASVGLKLGIPDSEPLVGDEVTDVVTVTVTSTVVVTSVAKVDGCCEAMVLPCTSIVPPVVVSPPVCVLVPPLLFPLPLPSPKVNDWLELPESHGATSTVLPETVKQLPFSFRGWKERGPEEPSKANIWELVTSPPRRDVSAKASLLYDIFVTSYYLPPSARPPHEKRMTWFPAARRGS